MVRINPLDQPLILTPCPTIGFPALQAFDELRISTGHSVPSHPLGRVTKTKALFMRAFVVWAFLESAYFNNVSEPFYCHFDAGIIRAGVNLETEAFNQAQHIMVIGKNFAIHGLKTALSGGIHEGIH